jgi:DNA helicase-2/ATP-dependent DNA helicase PcrA
MAEFEYTDNQKKAINHDNGHLRIIACAGSGKTQVISQRIANLIKKGVPSNKIVAFTFTVKAAEEMKHRIRKILEKECPNKSDFGDMYVGTIDAFCFQILQDLEPKYKNYDVLEGAQRVAYLSKPMNFNRLKLWELKNYGKGDKALAHYTVIDRFLKTSDIIMMERINPENIDNEHFKKGYFEYIRMLEEDKWLDFPSITRTLLDILNKKPNTKKLLHDKIKHLVVDEYQDVNKIQEELIEIISEGADSVCVVGDDDQCIYSWRGSHINNIINFDKKYGEKCKVTDIPLDINFRSTEAVIHTAREFIKKNKNRLHIKEMKASDTLKLKYEKGDIIYHLVETEKEELEYIYNKIEELINTDFIDKKGNPFSLSYGDIAILVRRNAYAPKVLDYLTKKKIKCIAYSGDTVFNREEVRLAMDCISYVFSCRKYEHYSSEPPTIDELKNDYQKVFNKNDFPTAEVNDFENEINKVKSEVDRILEKEKDKKDYLGDLGLQGIYHKILSALGGQRFDFGDVYNYHLAVLSSAISDYESVWKRLRAIEVKDFFQFAKSFGENNYTDTQHDDTSLIDAVKVLTIHKAKGLEFPVVFLPDMVKHRKNRSLHPFISDNLFPVDLYLGNDEDERRIFYTAFTRSEKYLIMTGSHKQLNKDGGYNKRDYPIHPFVEELDKKFISSDLKLERNSSGHPPRIIKDGIFPTSFSQITTFDRCPHDYQLRHVYGFNAGVPAGFGYGTNIHNILNIIHNKYIRKKKVMSDDEIDKLIDDVFFLRYATDAIAENMKIGARRVIKNYIRIHKKDFNKILETEKRFEFVLDEAIISGQIDLIKKVDEEGILQEVEIIDFKTEKNEDNDELYRIDYEKQLRLYALACLESLGLSPNKAVIHHLDKKLLFRKSKVDIRKEKLNETENQIKQSVTKILNKDFKANPSKLCKECDYKYLCSKKDNYYEL